MIAMTAMASFCRMMSNKTLKYWYSECRDYQGYWTSDVGHFTHMVWKTIRNYGMWARSCSIPGSNYKCVVALKTNPNGNLNVHDASSMNRNVEKNYCANVEN